MATGCWYAEKGPGEEEIGSMMNEQGGDGHDLKRPLGSGRSMSFDCFPEHGREQVENVDVVRRRRRS